MSATVGPFTTALPARNWVRDVLVPYGIGVTRIAQLSGVAESAVASLMNGRPDRGEPPPPVIPAAMSNAILSVEPVPRNLAHGEITAATGMCRRMQALVANGWSERALGERLGCGGAHLRRLLCGARQTVSAGLAMRARLLYDELWDQMPPVSTRGERISVSRSRQHAIRQGWAPPMAWDDGDLDDPDAGPQPWQRRSFWRAEELVAEAEDLGRVEGYDRAQAAERLGVERKSLDKAYSRVSERAVAAA